MRLGEICVINPKAPALDDDINVSFVPMPKVGENGEFDPSEIKKYHEVKKGFTFFRDGDILFAKITPCMENGKGAIARSMENGIGFGSTEFHVLRPENNVVIGEWVYYLLNWSPFRKEAEKNMTGSAGQKRVPKSFLENFEIALPDTETQKNQVKTLQTLDILIPLRKQQLAKLDELVKARFVELFGDCNKQTSIKESGLTISDGNYSSKYPRSEEFVESGIPFIRANNLKNGTVIDEDMYYITPEKHKILLKGHLKPNDVLITTRGNIGQVAIVPEKHNDSNINAQIVLLRDENSRFIPQYLLWALQTEEVKVQYLELQTGTALKQLPVGRLEQVKIKEPPIELQNQFAAFVEQTDKSKSAIQQSLDKLETLKAALMQKYFG